VTKPLIELLIADSVKISVMDGLKVPFNMAHVQRALNSFLSIDYRKPFKIARTEITAFDAGHIPGSASFYLDFGGKSLLYTGDFNTIDTRLLRAIDRELPKGDILVTECTYSERDHPDRRAQERELIRIVEDTLATDKVVLIAGFAVARLNEVLLILDSHGIDYPVYMDGMAKDATTIITEYRSLLKEPQRLDSALEKIKYVYNDRERKRIVREPGVILTTSGMLEGGPITFYLQRLHNDERCALVLSGWQIEDTPGKILLETGRYVGGGLDLPVKMFVKRLDFSSHVGRSGLFKFIERANPERVFCVHGDHTEEFALELRERGFDAIAPVASNRIFVI
jgi:putative mRNA 3-end processing factor